MRKLTPLQEKLIRRRVRYLCSKQGDRPGGPERSYSRPVPVSGVQSIVFLGRRLHFRRNGRPEAVREVLVEMFRQASAAQRARLHSEATQSQIKRAFVSISANQDLAAESPELLPVAR